MGHRPGTRERTLRKRVIVAMTTAAHLGRFLTLVGTGLAAIGILGIGVTLWFGGFNPSRWFIITAGGMGRAISGWTVTSALCGAFVVGLLLLVVAHRRRQLRP